MLGTAMIFFFFFFPLLDLFLFYRTPNSWLPRRVGGGDFIVNFHLWFPNTLKVRVYYFFPPISLADSVPLKGFIRLSQMQFCGALPSLRQVSSGSITPNASLQQPPLPPRPPTPSLPHPSHHFCLPPWPPVDILVAALHFPLCIQRGRLMHVSDS